MSTPWGTFQTGGPLPHVQQFVGGQASQRGADLVVEFGSIVYEYGITELNINGPKASLVEVWIGPDRVDTTTRTDSNTASYPTPKRVPPNSRVQIIWKNATGTANASLTTVSY